MQRIILDTNVLVDGVQDENSHTYRIISLCIEGRVQAVLSHPIKKENDLLARQLINDEEYLNIIDDYYDSADLIQVKNKTHIIEDDREDDKFIQAALDGNVNVIISSDHHLLDIGEFQNVKIMSPQEYWNYYKSQNGEEQEEWQEWLQGIGIQ